MTSPLKWNSSIEKAVPLNICTKEDEYIQKQDAQGPHFSPEKTDLIIKHR